MYCIVLPSLERCLHLLQVPPALVMLRRSSLEKIISSISSGRSSMVFIVATCLYCRKLCFISVTCIHCQFNCRLQSAVMLQSARLQCCSHLDVDLMLWILCNYLHVKNLQRKKWAYIRRVWYQKMCTEKLQVNVSSMSRLVVASLQSACALSVL